MKLFFAVMVAFLVAFGAATKSVDYIEKRVLSKAEIDEIDAFIQGNLRKGEAGQDAKRTRKRKTRRALRMKMNGAASSKTGKSAASGCGKSGKGSKSLKAGSLEYKEDIFVAPGSCPGQCLQDVSATMFPSPPLIEPCDPTDEAQVWAVQPVAGNPLPIFQFKAKISGYCTGLVECADTDVVGPNVEMMPCSDPRTHWITTSGYYIQSFYCFATMAVDTSTNGAGFYWDVGGTVTDPDCDVANEINLDDLVYFNSGPYLFDACQIEFYMSNRMAPMT